MEPHGAAALASLEALLGEDSGRVVVTTPEGPLRLGDLWEAAARVQALAAPGQRWVLACGDPFAFLAGLLGLSAADATALLPPNHLPETLALAAREAHGLLQALPTEGGGAPLGPLRDIDLVFWTSGSTGQPKAVTRRLSQLTDEVAVLERLFGSRFQEGPVLGTVPHHHIYGCLFRVLWPFLAGRPFAVEASGHPDHVPQEHGALVSSPAHLSRMLRLVDFGTIAHPLAAVFSSGGPLARQDALAWRRWVKEGVVEVFGSTESGGIAWRIQDEAEDSLRWQPFPDVAVDLEEDGALRVTCPRVPGGALRMEDAATLHDDGRFTLLGRLDRVVKVEEKRASLPELEAVLEAQPGVRQAALLVLEGPRTRLGAVVAMDAPPTDAPGRRALSERLRQALGQRFDAVLLPRRWRFVHALPADARGKLSQAALRALFAEPTP